MNTSEISSILSRFNTQIKDRVTAIDVKVYAEKYTDLAKSFFDYSKKILTLEGVVSEETPAEYTATDLALAKALVNDVRGGDWEGRGQPINKIFSILLGRNLKQKEVGMKHRLTLPKGVVVKTNSGNIGMISEQGNLMTLSGGSLRKDTSYEKYNTNTSLPTEDEILTFVGEVFETPTALRNFASSFKVGNVEEATNMLAQGMNGINTEQYDDYEYKAFISAVSPNAMFAGGSQ